MEFVDEPTERPYGVDCGLRDPFGNNLRITQPVEGPVDFSQADRDAMRPQPARS